MAQDPHFDPFEPLFFIRHVERLFLPVTVGKLGNWITAGFVKPDFRKHPRGGKDRWAVTLIELTRIHIIEILVNKIGIRPSHGVAVADFSVKLLIESLERNQRNLADGVPNAQVHVLTALSKFGRMKSIAVFRKQDVEGWFAEDPYRNPN